jgi:hypothetical protein
MVGRNRPLRKPAAALAAAVLWATAPAGASAGAGTPAPAAPRSGAPPIERSIAELPGGEEFLTVMRELDEAEDCRCEELYPRPDVDGDGTDDVLHATYTESPELTELDVLDGATGRSLFGAPVRLSGSAYATTADLGGRGRGLLYFSYDRVPPGSAVTIGAVTASGERLWERRWQRVSGAPADFVTAGELQALDVIEAGGLPTDLVVASSSSVSPTDTSAGLLERISGASGFTVDQGSYDAESAYYLRVDALEGVSAPGASDLLIQTSSPDRGEITMELRPEVSSPPTWSRKLKSSWSSLYPWLADVTGDAAAEILVGRNDRMDALGGSTGDVVWSAAGYFDAAVPAGRNGKDPAGVLMGQTERTDGRVTHEVVRLARDGTPSWRASFPVSAHVCCTTSGHGDSTIVGDATGDGAPDVRVDVSISQDDGDSVTLLRSRQFLVDGRTGATLRSGLVYFPLAGSFTASGSDAIQFHRTDEGLEVSAHDGASHKRLWRVPLGVPRSPACTWWMGVLHTTEGPDLLMLDVPARPGDREMILDGGSGELLWEG